MAKRTQAALLILVLCAHGLIASGNTTWYGVAIGDSSIGEETVFGGSVSGQLVFEESSWQGVGYSVSALSNFKAHDPSLEVVGGLGYALRGQAGEVFSVNAQFGLSLLVASRPIFADFDFGLGPYASLLADFKLGESFSLYLSWTSVYYPWTPDSGWRVFALENTLSCGVGWDWNPDSPEQEMYVIY